MLVVELYQEILIVGMDVLVNVTVVAVLLVVMGVREEKKKITTLYNREW
jgi:hypothetical protein